MGEFRTTVITNGGVAAVISIVVIGAILYGSGLPSHPNEIIPPVTSLQNTNSSMWDHTYGAGGHQFIVSVKQTLDGGYIAAGFTNSTGAGAADGWLMKLDQYGNIEWQRTYGGPSNDSFASVQQTPDGGYIVGGWTSSFGAGNSDFWVLKLDSGGNVVWQKTYGGAGYDQALTVQLTLDGGYVVGGISRSFGDYYQAWILKLNATGGIVWQKAYGNGQIATAWSLQQTSDGGFVFAGGIGSNPPHPTTNYTERYLWVVKLDSLGNLVWQKMYGGNGYNQALFVRQTSDGGYIVDGQTTSFGPNKSISEPLATANVWVLKLDQDGSIVWQKVYSGSGIYVPNQVEQAADGGYVIVGGTFQDGKSNQNAIGAWVLKIDSGGGLVWQDNFNVTAESSAYTVQQTKDGGYIVGGGIRVSGRGGTGWLMKLDSYGKTESCHLNVSYRFATADSAAVSFQMNVSVTDTRANVIESRVIIQPAYANVNTEC